MRIPDLLMKVRSATPNFAFFCLVAGCAIPLSAQATNLEGILKGKTVKIRAQHKVCRVVDPKKCNNGTVNVWIKFTTSGDRLVYYDKDKGVLIRRGSNSGVYKDPLFGDIYRSDIRYNGDNIILNSSLKFKYGGGIQKYNFIMKISNKKCSLLNFSTSYVGRVEYKTILYNKPIGCSM